MEQVFEPLRIIAGLRARGVSFVLTGDLAAMSHGADLNPDRVEICVDQESHVIERLPELLMPLGGERTDDNDDDGRAEYRTVVGDLECVALAPGSFSRIREGGMDVRLGKGVVARVAAPEDLTKTRIASGDLVGAMRAVSLVSSSPTILEPARDAPVGSSPAVEIPEASDRFISVEDEDEYGPDPSDNPKTLFGKVMKGAEKIDRFMTRLNEGGGKRY